MEKFFGGEPLWVILRLAVISLILGIVMATFNLDAFAIVQKLRELIQHVYNLGFDAIRWALEYFILGAVIVFPIWLVMRLFTTFKSGKSE